MSTVRDDTAETVCDRLVEQGWELGRAQVEAERLLSLAERAAAPTQSRADRYRDPETRLCVFPEDTAELVIEAVQAVRPNLDLGAVHAIAERLIERSEKIAAAEQAERVLARMPDDDVRIRRAMFVHHCDFPEAQVIAELELAAEERERDVQLLTQDVALADANAFELVCAIMSRDGVDRDAAAQRAGRALDRWRAAGEPRDPRTPRNLAYADRQRARDEKNRRENADLAARERAKPAPKPPMRSPLLLSSYDDRRSDRAVARPDHEVSSDIRGRMIKLAGG